MVKPILFCKISPSHTYEGKDREWARVAKNVSAVSGIYHTVESVMKKCTTLASETKKKEYGRWNEQTPSITPSETRMLSVIDKVNNEGRTTQSRLFYNIWIEGSK